MPVPVTPSGTGFFTLRTPPLQRPAGFFLTTKANNIMANKIKLGARPKTFRPVTVIFPMPDGSEGAIEISFTYRTRTEFGQMLDEIIKDAGSDKPVGEATMAELMAKTRDKNASYLSRIIHSWNLDEKLNHDTLAVLADEIPAAANVIMERYREAALEGRLGN